ncbi:uncharacterized protein BCR38DRAFT_484419 [Pseudomassariella vexata]|uniref:Cytochrome P450 n=1 Tax=Pseudomassariella vexata TaxID=1141098 RepID=A0A1Y2E0S7_9PEZI|nr:uncharacterized protein BCR38DRAFT_484419 [Pseudomassariella vexata]ORY64946.1 hypothetical protein BCR38DRAFT_484419 [Pseudomassariella vexata]
MAIDDGTLAWSDLYDVRLLVLPTLPYTVGIAIYRLYFSPLAKSPGPKIAALAALFYPLLTSHAHLARLKAELETAVPDPNKLPVAANLDGLPFLNAPDGKKIGIPAGTAMGMSAPLITRHPDVYDQPDEFRPDRYIEKPGLTKYLM